MIHVSQIQGSHCLDTLLERSMERIKDVRMHPMQITTPVAAPMEPVLSRVVCQVSLHSDRHI